MAAASSVNGLVYELAHVLHDAVEPTPWWWADCETRERYERLAEVALDELGIDNDDYEEDDDE